MPSNSQSYDWNLDTDQNKISTNDMGEFLYDHVYDPLSSNYDVYGHTVKPVIDKCMDGFNGTIFAYGMTGSGKTHSMQGSEYEAGIIQLAVNEIYERIEFDQHRKNYTVTLSYLEIYNEKLYDLLNPDTSNALRSTAFSSSVSTASLLKDDLKIRDDPVFGVNIVGLHNQAVNSPDELLTHIARGDSIRRTGGTDFNARSSRSHAIVMIRLRSVDISTSVEKFSTLSLCDLAGSEKATTQQERRKEGAFINKSLLALSTVISKLSAQSLNNSSSSAQSAISSRTHIPYRDSKLTRLLQSSLSGSSVISILCTIHLSSSTMLETMNTLRFAARAKNIQLTVKKNEATMATTSFEKDKIIQKLKQELEKYKREAKVNRPSSEILTPVSSLSQSRATSVGSSNSFSNDSDRFVNDSKLRDEINQLEAENKILTEQVEHFKRLNDYSRLNSTMLKNECIQSLSSLEVNRNYQDIPEILIGLDDFYKKQAIEIEELSSYISHLENRLKVSELARGTLQHSQTTSSHDTVNNLDGSTLSSIIKEQEEEILELKEQISSKDSIIQALKNSENVRSSLSNGKFPKVRLPSLSSKKSDESMRSSNDIYSDMNLSVDMNSSVVMSNDFGLAHALRPVGEEKLNHSIQLNSSPPSKRLDIEESW